MRAMKFDLLSDDGDNVVIATGDDNPAATIGKALI